MPNFGTAELIIIFLIIMVLFGAGRIAQLGGALGQSIRDFRGALRETKAAADEAAHEAQSALNASER